MSDCIGTGCKAAVMLEQIEALRRERDGAKTLAIMYCEQLAASQAYAEKLLEALDTALGCIDGYYRSALDAEFALADSPFDDTCLRQAKAKLLRDAADEMPVVGAHTFLRRMADELEKA